MPEMVEAGKLRRRVIFLLVFLALIFLLIFTFRAVLAPFLIAIFFAYLIDPVIERMAARVGRGGAIVIIYLVLIGCLYLASIFAIPALGRQLRQARSDLPKAQKTLELAAKWAEDKYHEFVGKPEGEEEEEPLKSEENPVPAEASRTRLHLKPEGQIVGTVVGRTATKLSVQAGDDFYVLDRAQILREEVLEGGEDSRRFLRLGVDEFLHNLDSILGFAIRVIFALVKAAYGLVLILMITAFLVIDRPAIVRFIKSLAPERYRETYEGLTVYVDRGLAGVIRGQLGIMAVNGLLTWLGLQFLGVSYSLLLGLLAGIFSIIPIFGTILSTIPIVLIAWATGGVHKGLLALGWILLIHFIEANYLNPRIMGTASKIHPVVVIFALVAGEHAYGIPGALLAVPAASILQSAFKFYVIDRMHEKTLAPEPG
ncbi:MAG: AI-2E family transporter [Planctomycetota bacterium]|jgi:predicted PurR-regulated permease PerM